MEGRILASRGYKFRVISTSGIVGKNIFKKIVSLAKLPLALVESWGVLFSIRPSLVLGMGGFASGPAVLSAALWGIPTAIAEQNAVAGRTNRLLGRVVKRVFVSFPQSKNCFPKEKVRVTGNPIRQELLEAASRAAPLRWNAGEDEEFHLLVFGGSRGAAAINRLIMEAMPALKEFPFPLKVIHQATREDMEELEGAYEAHGISHQVLPFIEHMEKAYTWSHLIVCRAGASSLAEIALFRRPSILIPFPHAADDHQRANALVFQREGAALCLEQGSIDGAALAAHIEELARQPSRLHQMASAAGRLARPDAADRIVQECVEMVSRGGGPP
jgi:UDP-N-acetylglucosamine--N-acetylmuramyl-(pentapeptide) pyrophosphoryl-undecaprenol N-acetylglucosamine transferase